MVADLATIRDTPLVPPWLRCEGVMILGLVGLTHVEVYSRDLRDDESYLVPVEALAAGPASAARLDELQTALNNGRGHYRSIPWT